MPIFNGIDWEYHDLTKLDSNTKYVAFGDDLVCSPLPKRDQASAYTKTVWVYGDKIDTSDDNAFGDWYWWGSDSNDLVKTVDPRLETKEDAMPINKNTSTLPDAGTVVLKPFTIPWSNDPYGFQEKSTPQGVCPDVPRNLHVTDVMHDRVTVNWKGETYNGRADVYLSSGIERLGFTVNYDGAKGINRICGLQPATTYNIEIELVNAYGSTKSNVLTFTTANAPDVQVVPDASSKAKMPLRALQRQHSNMGLLVGPFSNELNWSK